MFCSKCGNQMDEGQRFCPKCGNPAFDAQAPPTPVPPPSPTPAKKGKRGIVIGASIAGAVVLAFIVLALVGTCSGGGAATSSKTSAGTPAASSSSGTVSGVSGAGPDNDRIRSDIEAKYLNRSYVDSTYSADTDYKLDTLEVTKREETKMNEQVGCEVSCTAIIKSTDVSVEVETVLKYNKNSKGSWLFSEVGSEKITKSPLVAVSDETILKQAQSVLGAIDKQDEAAKTTHKDQQGNTVKLQDLYSNATVTLEENTTSADTGKGTATIKLVAEKTYWKSEATLSLQFFFTQEGKGGWYYHGAAVDDAGYQMDYSKMVGTWMGTWEETSQSNRQPCFGAKSQPLVMTVKSVDSVAMTAVVDMTFLLHNHGELTNPQDSTEGDTSKSLEGVLIIIDLDSGSYRAYRGNDPIYYGIHFQILDDSIKVEIRNDSSFELTRRSDFYTLTKTS